MLIRNKCLNPVALPHISGSDIPMFRCGVCPNCLRHKKNELAVRFLRQLQGRKSVSLLTFTYDTEHCPVRRTVSVFDVDSGEVLDESTTFVEDASERLRFFKSASYELKYTQDGKPVKRYRPFVFYLENLGYCDGDELIDLSFDDSPVKYVNHVVEYQSVRYEDMQLCLKRARRRGVNLTDFVCVPEYGSLGFRPHYHLLAIGLSQSDCNILVDCWRERGRTKCVDGKCLPPASLGHVDVRQVSTSNEEELRRVSSYLAKYCAKGKYDCPFIRAGYCDKPRRSVSEGFGVGSLRSLLELSYDLLRWDLYGRYDPRNMSPELLDRINPDALAAKRCIVINGRPYPVPRYLLTKIFSKKDSHFKDFKETNEYDCVQKAVFGPETYHSTPLQYKVKIALVSRALQDIERESERFDHIFKDNQLFTDSLDTDSKLRCKEYERSEQFFIDDLEKSQLIPM